MVDIWIVVLRGVQYAAGALLLGLPAFMLYSQRAVASLELRWPRQVLIWAAAALAVAAPAALLAQTAMMAGSLNEAVKPASLAFMVTGMGLGKALMVRTLAAALALGATLLLRPGRPTWSVLTLLGVIVSASFAWTGHGAATEGAGHAVHLISDVVHAVAASIWIGALAAFAVLIGRRPSSNPSWDASVARSLTGFAGVGTAAVGALVVTGLINSAFLVGPSKALELWTSPYGDLLMIKLVLFGLMVGLAAVHRFRLAPLMARDAGQALPHLKKSLTVEFAVALAILAVIAVMGTLPPPAAL
ncbi:copper resistance protein CopD [Brevundimonas naejangsanensis]|uniref:Copper resistance protein CopD n=1 Tax=Brevundimonas naejangsanensis TaxID=588932 RepID=A0A494RM15_9CAUL|nr:copper homeostasis membrane protein CopD [Brevundimonas naejangsanensis]AYG95760.1 copper resistance protein CopD [Brevundimonas naejangsanensis]